MWNMAHGKHPFAKANGEKPGQADAFQIILNAAIEHKRPAISPPCPASLGELIERAWHREPAERPTAEQLLTELQSLKAGSVATKVDSVPDDDEPTLPFKRAWRWLIWKHVYWYYYWKMYNEVIQRIEISEAWRFFEGERIRDAMGDDASCFGGDRMLAASGDLSALGERKPIDVGDLIWLLDTSAGDNFDGEKSLVNLKMPFSLDNAAVGDAVALSRRLRGESGERGESFLLALTRRSGERMNDEKLLDDGEPAPFSAAAARRSKARLFRCMRGDAGRSSCSTLADSSPAAGDHRCVRNQASTWNW